MPRCRWPPIAARHGADRPGQSYADKSLFRATGQICAQHPAGCPHGQTRSVHAAARSADLAMSQWPLPYETRGRPNVQRAPDRAPAQGRDPEPGAPGTHSPLRCVHRPGGDDRGWHRQSPKFLRPTAPQNSHGGQGCWRSARPWSQRWAELFQRKQRFLARKAHKSPEYRLRPQTGPFVS